MNKTKIEWTDYTWNPITGCINGCSYCYARKIYKRFKRSFTPAFHRDRLFEPFDLKRPSKIFACSVSDFWGLGVDPGWREDVLDEIKACPQHTFQILTKQPQNIEDDFEFPKNLWIGVTVTSRKDQWRIKALEEKQISNQWVNRTFISYEPMLDWIDIIGEDSPIVDWFIFGALSGGKKQPCPNIEGMISYVIDWAKAGPPEFRRQIFMKNSLKKYWKGKLIQEFPT